MKLWAEYLRIEIPEFLNSQMKLSTKTIQVVEKLNMILVSEEMHVLHRFTQVHVDL